MNSRGAGFVSAEANLRAAKVKRRSRGRSQNEARIRQAVRGVKDMFRKDGLS
jgi:hypothetical protein